MLESRTLHSNGIEKKENRSTHTEKIIFNKDLEFQYFDSESGNVLLYLRQILLLDSVTASISRSLHNY